MEIESRNADGPSYDASRRYKIVQLDRCLEAVDVSI